MSNLATAVLGVFLAVGLLWMVHRQRCARTEAAKTIYIGCAMLYLVMMMRELNWGRVFFPVGINASGEQIFIKMSEIWFAPLIYAVVAGVVLTAVIYIIKSLRICRRQKMSWKLPVWHFASFAVLMVVSQCIFEHGYFVGERFGQMLEEAAEITAYVSLVCFTAHFSIVKR